MKQLGLGINTFTLGNTDDTSSIQKRLLPDLPETPPPSVYRPVCLETAQGAVRPDIDYRLSPILETDSVPRDENVTKRRQQDKKAVNPGEDFAPRSNRSASKCRVHIKPDKFDGSGS